jgi:hypothetical protein
MVLVPVDEQLAEEHPVRHVLEGERKVKKMSKERNKRRRDQREK